MNTKQVPFVLALTLIAAFRPDAAAAPVATPLAAPLAAPIGRFFANYALIQSDPAQFRLEQSRLLAPGLVTVVRDPRGVRTYAGPDGYFQSLADWAQVYSTGPDFRVEPADSLGGRHRMRLHGTLVIRTPQGPRTVLPGQHCWDEAFTFEGPADRPGRIAVLEVNMNLGCR